MRAHIPKPTVVSLFLLAAFPAHGSDCDCKDILDLEIREAKANAAIDEYRKIMSEWRQASSIEELPPPGVTKFRLPLQERVNKAMSQFSSPRETFAKAETNEICEVTNVSESKCMVATLDAHEQVHATACRTEGVTRFLRGNMETYAREEISGYQAERSYIQGELARLRRDCARDLSVKIRQHFYNGCLEWQKSGEAAIPVGEFMDVRSFAPMGKVVLIGRAQPERRYYGAGYFPLKLDYCRARGCDKDEKEIWRKELSSPTCGSQPFGQPIAIEAMVFLEKNEVYFVLGEADIDDGPDDADLTRDDLSVSYEDLEPFYDIPEVPCVGALCRGVHISLDGPGKRYSETGEQGDVEFDVSVRPR